MRRYRYRARSKDGKLITGIVEATDENQAVSLLRERGLIVIKLTPDTNFARQFLVRINRVSLTGLANFTRQLATTINAGLPLVDSLAILENQNEGALKSSISKVRSEVEGGKALSDSMATQDKVFDKVYTSMIKAGETGGVLDEVLLKLADNMEKKREFQSKVKGALLYPAIILIGMIAVMIIMILFVIPQLSELYLEFEADLPLITTVLISVSKLASQYWWLGIFLLLIPVFMRRIINNNRNLRKKAELFMLSTPVFGKLWEQVMMTTLTRTMSLLVSSGVPIVDSLHLSSQVTSSKIYEDSIIDSAKLVEKGFSLAQAFTQQDHFPQIVTQMMTVGEETGKVDELLDRISIYFQNESEQGVKNLTTAMEPMILIFLGGGVAFLVFAIVMPIYNLTTTL